MISFQSESESLPEGIDDSVTSWIENIIINESAQLGQITYFFCSDQYIIDVNKAYLNHDYYTDIITFDYSVNKVISGDLVISVDTVASNAIKFNKSYHNELLRVVIHGILHLLGYKDKSEEDIAIMRQKEDEALKLFPTFL